MVTREEFRNKLWAADTFVDFDHGLNAAIKRVRDALGEAAEAPLFIETLPRRGYRFLCPVVVCGRTHPHTWTESLGLETVRRFAFYLSLITVVLLGTGIFVGQRWWRALLGSRPDPPGTMRVVPFTTYPGAKLDPAISPDVRQVAFVSWGHWTVGKDGMYFIDETGQKPTLELYRYTDGKVSRIATLERAVPPGEPALDVSPDGRHVVVLHIQSDVDIMIIENFR